MRFENVTERNKTRLRLHKKKCPAAQSNRVTNIVSVTRPRRKDQIHTFLSQENVLQAVKNQHVNHHEKKKAFYSGNKEMNRQIGGMRE